MLLPIRACLVPPLVSFEWIDRLAGSFEGIRVGLAGFLDNLVVGLGDIPSKGLNEWDIPSKGLNDFP